MKILKKRAVATIVMSLLIFAALVPMGGIPIGRALCDILILLIVFAVIDIVMEVSFLSRMKRMLVSIMVASVAIIAISLASKSAYTDVTENIINSVVSSRNMENKPTNEYLMEGEDSNLANPRQKALEDAAGYAETEDYAMAINIIEEALKEFPNDETLLDQLEDYSSAYHMLLRADAVTSAKEFSSSQDFENAALTVKAAIDKLGNDDELVSLYEAYCALSLVALPDWYIFEEVVIKGNQICFSRLNDVIWGSTTSSSSVNVFSFDSNGNLYDVRNFILLDTTDSLAQRYCAELNTYLGEDNTNGFGMHKDESTYYCYNNVIVEIFSQSYINSNYPSSLPSVVEYYASIELKDGKHWPITYLD